MSQSLAGASLRKKRSLQRSLMIEIVENDNYFIFCVSRQRTKTVREVVPLSHTISHRVDIDINKQITHGLGMLELPPSSFYGARR